MRIQRSSLVCQWVVVLTCSTLAGCNNAPPPTTVGFEAYRPASLAEAVVFRDRTAVENFLALGVDPNETEPDGTTPLMRAIHGQMPEIAQLLIDAGADVKKANLYGVTALYVAARAGDAVAVRLLLAAGADANAVLPAAGESVLITATRTGDSEVVRALLTAGDDTITVAEIGEARAAARIAESAGYAPSGNQTLALYADVNARERLYGRTPLMIAAAEGHVEVAQLLIEAGADLDVADLEGSTALSLARSYNNLDIAADLEAAGATR